MSKNVLVFNVGSSSLSYKLFACSVGAEPRTVAAGKAHRVGTASTEKPLIEHRLVGTTITAREERDTLPSHADAASAVLDWLQT